MNERQSAYRSAESIIGLLADHGKDCPECYSTCYTFSEPQTFTLKPRLAQSVCARCRGFGRVFFLTQDQFLNFAHYTYTLRTLIDETDCPT